MADRLEKSGQSSPIKKSILDGHPDWDAEISVETETDDYIVREILVSKDGQVRRETITIFKQMERKH